MVPTGVTQVGGVILIAHGSDTFVAGFRTLWTGQVQSSLTQQVATSAAGALGASPEAARTIGTGVDMAAGMGPSIAVGVTRRLALVGAERATASVAVAYLDQGALALGHNAVGIRQGGTTAWVRFAGKAPGRVVPMLHGPNQRYAVTELAVTIEQANRAQTASRVLMASGPQAWGVLSPNCTTTARTVLQQAGIVVPQWSRTPFLLHLGLNHGAEITFVGGAVATGAPAIGRR